MHKEALQIIWVLLQVCVGWHLFLPFFLMLSYYMRNRVQFPGQVAHSHSDYAVIVTAFEQTDNIPLVVSSLLKMVHPDYVIYVVADKCDVSHLHFNDSRVMILRPEQVLASNTRSHFYAISRFKRPHNRLVIIDSDNLAEPDLLKKLDVWFDRGFEAVQGIRKAKNLDTDYARLDAARDMYYHFFDGEVLFGLGSSAALSGSGMAFTTRLYQECLGHLDITGAGFDKVLQAEILKRDLRIAFAPDAVIYDEKTSQSDQLVNQRARWINTWFKYFGYGFAVLGKGLRNLSRNQILFGMIQLRPPLFLMLIASLMCMVVSYFYIPQLVWVWSGGFLSFMTAFIISLLHARPDKRIYKSLISIPKFIFFQTISLLNSRRANKRSVATRHFHHSDPASPGDTSVSG